MSDSLQKIYASIPEIPCKGLCQQSCGPIAMSPREHEAMIAIAGAPLPPTSLRCPFLNPDGKCSVYAARPVICRLWGAVKAMRCPFGCVPKRWLTDDESSNLLERAMRIGGGDEVWTHSAETVFENLRRK